MSDNGKGKGKGNGYGRYGRADVKIDNVKQMIAQDATQSSVQVNNATGNVFMSGR